ncbi:response regulator receiver modulated diguanylate cyclase [Tamilnaduibacter salinus]|uniref:diguanylate cyclase n=1 Tax=Tamilnaduibacter salinus TaxID=1484056 RepID=A0A2U1CTJ0_9GAMM|nr:diguanylate cyclase [Tamilnaduibacter salinus]PVY70056.1 response regulator receiver modulated diguanylate cyclase [Tamilnaduibacter salinus]
MADRPSKDQLGARLQELRSAYRERLNDELAAITRLAEEALNQTDAAESITLLGQKLHKLAGSAGTFGFHRLGSHARQLEQRIQEWLDGAASAASFNLIAFTQDLKTLQFHLGADEAASRSISVEHTGQEPEPDSPLIAVVERDEILAKYIAHQLESFGFRVRCYHDPQTFLVNNDGSTDLLLLDHRSGAAESVSTSTEHWQMLLKDVQCPVIFMGGHEDFFVRLEAVRAGADGYFVKPLNIPKVAKKITQSIRKQRQHNERILIIDDDAELISHLQTVLTKEGMVVEILSDPTRLINTTAEFQPELLLVDLNMPEVTGDELASMIRQFDQWNNLPILYLTREQSQEARAHALLSGGDDFINKPISDDYLIKTCRNRVRRQRDMQQAISHDGLTGLLRHANIKDALETELQGSRRSGNPLSVVMLDIDHFKQVNDTYGHALGDIVISTVGTLVSQHFRRSDRLGRYGGEEFVVALPNCDAKTAYTLVDRLRQAFGEISFVERSRRFVCTLSAGIADTQTFPDTTAEQLLDQADAALYRSKNAGRNCVSIASEPKESQ